MSARRILQLGDPTLRQRSGRVARPEDAAATLVDLRDTLHEFQRVHGFGRGISAVQIGVPQRVVYLEFEGSRYEMLNPEYVEMSAEKFTLWDDCFSFPNLMVRLERSRDVVVKYEDRDGVAKTLQASGALSELLQHEVDHLDGVLAIDRALDNESFATREEWERQRIGGRGGAQAAR